MIEKRKFTNGELDNALIAFGYELSQRGTHSVYRHPRGKQPIVLPKARPGDRAFPAHVTIAETAVSDDGVASREDFRFYLENGKLPDEQIKKGDKLVWTDPDTGETREVTAAAGEKDGIVVIKQQGVFAPCSVKQLKKLY